MARELVAPGLILAVWLLTAGSPSAQVALSVHKTVPLPASGAAVASGEYWRAVLSNGGGLPNHERLVVLGPGGQILRRVEGDSTGVALPDDLSVQLADFRMHAMLVHNHPANVSLSAADLAQLSLRGVERVVAVGHDGSVYEASAGPQYGDGEALASLYPDLLRRVLTAIVREARLGNANPTELFPHAPHLAAAILGRMQLIEYRARPSLPVRMVLERNRVGIDRVMNAQAARP